MLFLAALFRFGVGVGVEVAAGAYGVADAGEAVAVEVCLVPVPDPPADCAPPAPVVIETGAPPTVSAAPLTLPTDPQNPKKSLSAAEALVESESALVAYA